VLFTSTIRTVIPEHLSGIIRNKIQKTGLKWERE